MKTLIILPIIALAYTGIRFAIKRFKRKLIREASTVERKHLDNCLEDFKTAFADLLLKALADSQKCKTVEELEQIRLRILYIATIRKRLFNLTEI